jgi:ABC-2 type transport system permease protein
VSLVVHELRAQQLLFWRNREAAFFSFLFPILLLVLIGSVYGDEPIEGVSAPTFLLIGLLGYGVAANAFAALAITLVVRREAGLLKRVRGTPLGPGAYLSAVIGSTVVVIALQVAAQLFLGVYVLDADWPERPLLFAFAILLGAAAFAALGIAITTVVRTAEGSSAVVNAIYLPMAFISGVFFSTHLLPRPHPRELRRGRELRALRGCCRRGLGPRRPRRRPPRLSLGAARRRRRLVRRRGPACAGPRAPRLPPSSYRPAAFNAASPPTTGSSRVVSVRFTVMFALVWSASEP